MILLSGCSTPVSGAGSPTPLPPSAEPANPAIPLDELVGQWQLVEYITEDGVVHEVDSLRTRLTFFASGRLIDTTACDRFDGEYRPMQGTVILENLAVGPPLLCTEMAGTGDLWERGMMMALADDRLILTSAPVPEDDLGRSPKYRIRSFVLEHTG
jgi:hypothetical protein